MTKPEATLSRRSFAKVSLAASVALTSGASILQRVVAQGATPVGGAATPSAPGLPPIPEGTTLYAQGLWNPRFLAFGDDGTLYITENGIGGDEVIQPGGNGQGEQVATPGATPVAPEGTPAAEGPESGPITRGHTGQISMVKPDDVQSVLIDGLVSYSAGVGPVGLALGPGEVYFSIGGVAVGSGFPPDPQENTVNKVDVATGELTQLADLGQYEVEHNPDGTDVNPNLYMVAMNTDGKLLVADAGGNTIYSLDPATGDYTLAGVVPDLTTLSVATPTPEMGSGQPVPTSVAVGNDGTVYVGLLRENWPSDAPSILTMAADGTFTPFKTSEPLQFTVSLVAGPDGNLYASQLFGAMTDQGPGPGKVLRITPDGTVTPVIESVMMPHGVAFDDEGNLYVAINSLMSGPGMPAGQVVRMDGVAAAS